MKCILVFDQLNDILFAKYDKKFLKHIHKLGKSQGLECQDNDDVDMNFLIQLFAPVITSQRVMTSQFGNSYRSIQCQDGTNMVFDEYMGYLFICMGYEEINWLRRMLGIAVSIIQHLCGPDISVLKEDKNRCDIVCRLIDTWNSLVATDQSVLVEAIEDITTTPEVSGAVISSLNHATDLLKTSLDVTKSHAIAFIRNKFLALYSSKSAEELSSSDLLFLSLLAESQCRKGVAPSQNQLQVEKPFKSFASDQSSDEEFFSPETSPQIIDPTKPTEYPSAIEDKNEMVTEVVLLSHGHIPAVIPYALHMSPITTDVYLIILHQRCSESLSMGLHDSIESAVALLESDVTDLDLVKRNMDLLDSAIKKLFDNLKKLKSNEITPQIDATWKVVRSKWDVVKKQWKGEGQPVGLQGLVIYLKEFLHSPLFFDRYTVNKQRSQIDNIFKSVTQALVPHQNVLKNTSSTNQNQSSRASLSIYKYLEEFPALVHFIYIDRNNDRITAPTIHFDCPKTVQVTQRKIWSMVEFSRVHFQEGHSCLMWKDLTFNYAYFIWFEDTSGSPLKPKISLSTITRSLITNPGVIAGNFYKLLIEGCFPKMSSKVRCYELYCVHLGHVTSELVLEHCRRVAATVWEVRGTPTDPLDLF